MLLMQFRNIQHVLSLLLVAFTLTGCKVSVNAVGDGGGERCFKAKNLWSSQFLNE